MEFNDIRRRPLGLAGVVRRVATERRNGRPRRPAALQTRF
jgi:hypothetical protein